MMLISKTTGSFLLSFVSLSVISLSIHAQVPPKDTIHTQTLNTVQVNGWSNGQKGNQLDIARSIGMLTPVDFHRNNGLSLENSLNLIPGVVMQSRSAFGGQRISIRGYGNNTNFNGQGVQVLLNNIPVTDATGTTILDDVDFTTLGKVEVIKGPASSLYGSGIAGVVNLYTLKPQPSQTRFVEENTFGSYGLWRNNTRIETAGEHSALVFNYGHQESEGFRRHSASSKDYAQMSGDFYVSDKSTISTYFAYARSHEELAGEMDSLQFYGKQKWSDPAYLVNNSKVDIESFRGGVTSDYKIDGHFSNLSTVFFNGYTLNSPFAHGLTDNQAFTFGGRTGFVYTSGPGEKVHGIFGGQFQKTLAFNKSYNLTNDTVGGIRGDLQNASMAYNVFTEWKFVLPSQWILTAGGSLNFTEFSITDMLANSANPTHANGSGTRSFPAVFTPRLSLLKKLSDHVSVYADVSRGYTPPATSNVVIAAIGRVNRGLSPESGFQYEIGTKGDLIDRKLSYQLALFDLDVHNKIVSQTIPAAGGLPQYTEYVNAGRQQDLGAELTLSYLLLEDKTAAITRLRPFVTYAWSDFKYKDFKSDHNNNAATVDYSNKKVAGVAPDVLNIGVDLETKPGFYAYVTYRYNGAVPYTFDNLHYAKSYDLLNTKIGYRSRLGSHFSIDLYAGADNLTSSTYYTFLFYSGNLAGTTDPHFLPMPYKTTFYGGAKLAYIF
ncbi:MAG TPA: TonB-dependent receptor plug domain-containing protein [Puia sp.]|nr:TonB-dependent receptor plug domain-containing protein [Puia sp.]